MELRSKKWPWPLKNLSFRYMQQGDLETVSKIEAHCSPVPWNYSIFESCLISSYFCLVAEVGGKVVGFAILNLGFDEAHIMNLGVAPKYRSRGIARKLLQRLLEYCQQSQIESVLLEVRVSNTIAIELYHSLGFRIVGRRAGYYAKKEGREDAINMTLSLVG